MDSPFDDWLRVNNSESEEDLIDDEFDCYFDDIDLYELFTLFITEKLVDLIVTEINMYPERYLSFKSLKEFTRFHAWNVQTKITLSVYILHGLVWKPEIAVIM